MADWENEEEVVKPVAAAAAAAVDQWADEDAGNDDGPIMDSWDAEPEAPKPKAEPTVKPKNLKKQKQMQKALEDERRQLENSKLSAEEIRLRKAEEQAKVEDADDEIAKDLFGADISHKKTAVTDLNVELKTKDDYESFANTVGNKVANGNPIHVTAFLSTLLKLACENLKLEDVDKVKQVTTVIFNQTRTKESDKKKKKGASAAAKKKTYLKDDSSANQFQDLNAGEYDGDDYDFL